MSSVEASYNVYTSLLAFIELKRFPKILKQLLFLKKSLYFKNLSMSGEKSIIVICLQKVPTDTRKSVKQHFQFIICMCILKLFLRR